MMARHSCQVASLLVLTALTLFVSYLRVPSLRHNACRSSGTESASSDSTRTFNDVTSLSAYVDDQPVLNGADVIAAMRRNGVDPVLVSRRSHALPPATAAAAAAADGISAPDFAIPNVVHYVWFSLEKSGYEFKFLYYVGFVGVQRFIEPDAIFVHGNSMPTGRWWNRTVSEVSNVFFVKTPELLRAPSGQSFKWIQHAADFHRLKVIIGIYGCQLFCIQHRY
jgi:hypothetical protein